MTTPNEPVTRKQLLENIKTAKTNKRVALDRRAAAIKELRAARYHYTAAAANEKQARQALKDFDAGVR